MIEFDFTSMCNVNNKLYDRKDEVLNKFSESYMTGWTKEIDSSLVDDIIETSSRIKKHSKCLVVIGIGGSFLGSFSVMKAMSNYFDDEDFKIVYAGTTLSSAYMNDLLKYLDTVDFSVNVISKSGTTMEPTIAYTLVMDLMKKKYSDEEIKERLIITTDPVKGTLREEVNEKGYKSYPIPDDIGGRYSIMTAAHLFPLAFKIDLKEFIKGYYDGSELSDEAYKYAVSRKSLFDNKKYVENFVVFEEKLSYFSEWLKQLFGETEGKGGVGILPTSTIFTRDLHSLGQFVQEGNKILFETFIKIKDSSKVEFKSYDLHDINNIVLDSVRVAHKSGDVSSLMITIPCINEYYLGKMMYFFMLSAAYSGFLFDINPFDQPGVEVYKKEVKENIKL